MGQMIVRNIPDDVMERFKKAAKRAGKSAEALAREAIENAAVQDREQLMKEMDELRKLTKDGPYIDIVAEIRKDRER